ncbi:transposase [Streptomyces sp. NPDC007983]|uniref:transposase n=1 Tax=Streptomyces sp. NPDC007983 TaxID=3364800 RepID=UPI0036E1FAF4
MIPPLRPRQQGGGTVPVADRKVFTAVVYVLTNGCAWRYLPMTFGTSPTTAHRRFAAWIKASPWRRLHRAALDELGAKSELDCTSAIIDAASVRAKRGSLTRPGRSRQVGQQAAWLSRSTGHPTGRRDLRRERARQPGVQAAAPGPLRYTRRRGPRQRPVWVRADKAYFSAQHLTWVHSRGLIPRIARPGIESGEFTVTA